MEPEMTALAKNLPRYTWEDYRLWEGRWELIEGVPYAMAPLPSFEHQIVSGRIHVELVRALEGCPHCVALLPVDWKIDEHTVVQPDNLVVCGQLPPNPPLEKAPILIFEVLFPSTILKDRNLKFRLYERAGVKYLVLVDPAVSEAEIFELKEGQYALYRKVRDEKVCFDLGICEIEFDFGKIFLGGR